MKIALIVYLGFLSLFCVGQIYYYEDKVQNLKNAVSDYQRALRLSKNYSNADHYTHLQLENKTLLKTLKTLGFDNEALQVQVKQLKAEITQFRNAQPIQYESSSYNDNLNKFIVNSDFVYIQDGIDLEQ